MSISKYVAYILLPPGWEQPIISMHPNKLENKSVHNFFRLTKILRMVALEGKIIIVMFHDY